MNKTFSDEAECCKGICKPRDTAMFDNLETRVAIEQTFASQTEAEQALKQLTPKAREVESEPCEITSQIQANSEGFNLTATFHFSCQAEAVIFQLALR